MPGGPLNLNSTNLPRPWSPWESSPLGKNSHGRAGNRTRDLMISSQETLTTGPRGWSVSFVNLQLSTSYNLSCEVLFPLYVMDGGNKQRVAMKFCFKTGLSATETVVTEE